MAGDDIAMPPSSLEKITPEVPEGEWQILCRLFADLRTVQRVLDMRGEEGIDGDLLWGLRSSDEFFLWEGSETGNRIVIIDLEATSDNQPIIRAKMYEDDVVIDVLYEGQSLEEAERAIYSADSFDEGDISQDALEVAKDGIVRVSKLAKALLAQS